ncbi:unnamed protein product [Trichobilharzia regenti]|nr:unnamed protein product [Trichobilharzia regenti]
MREALKLNNYPDKLVRNYVEKCVNKNKMKNDNIDSDNNNNNNNNNEFDDNNSSNINDDIHIKHALCLSNQLRGNTCNRNDSTPVHPDIWKILLPLRRQNRRGRKL